MPTYESKGRVRVIRGAIKEANKETLVAVIAALSHDTDADFYHGIAAVICGVYDAKVPWEWHLEKVIRQYDRKFFRDAAWVQQFIDAYFVVVNKIQDEIYTETGALI